MLKISINKIVNSTCGRYFLVCFLFSLLFYSVRGAAVINLVNLTMLRYAIPQSTRTDSVSCDQFVRTDITALLDRVLQISGEQKRVYIVMGRLAAIRGCFDKAVIGLKQTDNFEPATFITASRVGQFYEAQGNRDAAIRTYRFAPDIARFRIKSGREAVAAGDFHKARYEFQMALEIAPDLPEAHYAVGEDYAYNEPRDYDRAIAQFYEAVNLGYTDGYVWIRIAHVYAMSGRYDMALAVLEQHPENDHLAYAIRGDAYRAMDLPAQAVENYLHSLKLLPDAPGIYVSLGLAYQELGRLDQALAAWQRALTLDPNFEPALVALRNLEGQYK